MKKNVAVKTGQHRN